MNTKLLAVILLFTTLRASSQSSPTPRQSTSPPPPDQTNNPLPRWTLSFNPLGLLEPTTAIGLGIGYPLNDKYELWAETSLLQNPLINVYAGPTKGIRQILQLK